MRSSLTYWLLAHELHARLASHSGPAASEPVVTLTVLLVVGGAIAAVRLAVLHRPGDARGVLTRRRQEDPDHIFRSSLELMHAEVRGCLRDPVLIAQARRRVRTRHRHDGRSGSRGA